MQHVATVPIIHIATALNLNPLFLLYTWWLSLFYNYSCYCCYCIVHIATVLILHILFLLYTSRDYLFCTHCSHCTCSYCPILQTLPLLYMYDCPYCTVHIEENIKFRILILECWEKTLKLVLKIPISILYGECPYLNLYTDMGSGFECQYWKIIKFGFYPELSFCSLIPSNPVDFLVSKQHASCQN